MAELKIEIPENVDLWGSLSRETREKVALFAYLEGVSVDEYLEGAIQVSVDSDVDNHSYERYKDSSQE